MFNVEIFQQVQLVRKFKAGNAVMIYKEFKLEGEQLGNFVTLIMSPFVRKVK